MPDPQQPASPGVPEQLRKQIEEAERLRAQMATQPSQEDPDQDDDEEEAGEGPGEGFSDEEEDGQSWEQRFRSQQGRFEQLMRSNQALTERVNELQRGLAQSHIKSPPAGAPPAQPKEAKKLVTPEEENEYGKDFFDVVGRRAQESVDPFFSEFDNRLKRLEGRQDAVHTVIESSAKQGMMSILNSAVPNWRQINVHPEFKVWLSQLDPYSGRPLKDMLLEAFSRQEARRVVSFFQGFLAEADGPPQETQARTPSAPPLAQPGNGSGKPSLADFAAPGRARSAPQTLPPEKSTYTQAQVQRLSDEKRRGLWRGREAQLDAIEADIFQAQHEGRLLP